MIIIKVPDIESLSLLELIFQNVIMLKIEFV